MSKLVIIDADYLAHRAFHSVGHLRGAVNERTGVMFGFLSTIKSLKLEFGKCRFAFCFDDKESLRRELYPEYKANRRIDYESLTDAEIFEKEQYHRQVRILRTQVLPDIGFKNIFHAPGFEGDDHIAQACLTTDRDAIIVSADHDMYQCLGKKVSIWNLNTHIEYTLDDFVKEYRIKPMLWSQVKAIAGCTSDNVKGIKGIGEKTAVKWFLGTLNPESKAYQKIDENIDIVAINLPLVRLPFEGTPEFDIVKDEVSHESWRNVVHNLGMYTLKKTISTDRHGGRRGTKRK